MISVLALTERLYFIFDTYVKSRENSEHQNWPDQSLYHNGDYHRIYVNIAVVS